jgi:hypothetical protein
MEREGSNTKLRVFAVSATLCSVLLGLAACQSREQPSEPGAATQGAGEPERAAPPAQGGMKAYVDPETGELTDTPPPGAEIEEGDVRMPGKVLGERPAPGGGVILDVDPDETDDDPAAE